MKLRSVRRRYPHTVWQYVPSGYVPFSDEFFRRYGRYLLYYIS